MLKKYKVFFLLLVISLVVKEQFPFSHFPMYSSFSKNTYLVYLRDRDDKIIRLEDFSSIRYGMLKKIYNTELKKVFSEMKKAGTYRSRMSVSVEKKSESAQATIFWLYNNIKSKKRDALLKKYPIKFYEVNIFLKDKKIIEKEELITVAK